MSAIPKMADVIIVGAGSAGCVLANRLSAEPSTSIVLIEAGGEGRHPFVTMPKGFAKLVGNPDMAWRYQTEAEPGGDRSSETLLRGRMLGGTSAINGMIYTRGQPEDFDEWSACAGPGWGWSEMSRCFQAMEDHSLGGDGVRGRGGPLVVTTGHFRDPVADSIVAAGVQMGLPQSDDFNGPQQEGVGYYAHTISNGRRFSAARAFLDPVRGRPNLHILTDAEVTRVVIEDGRATGVVVSQGGQENVYRANREVILCAGAFHSPKLLQLSGVGDAALLEAHNIPVVRHAPSVGRNMRDHVYANLVFRLRGNVGHNARLRGVGLIASVARYYLRRSGIMSTGAFEVGAFVRTRDDLDRVDAQLYLSPFSISEAGYMGQSERESGLTVAACLLRPAGSGEVSIAGRDPAMPPRIRTQSLADPETLAAGADLIRLVRRLAAQPALANMIAAELKPGAALSGEADLQAHFLQTARTSNHAVGTCRMGADEGAAVDARLRVRGVNGLRVVDASVMPVLSGNTNGPVMAVAWRAAELIRQDFLA